MVSDEGNFTLTFKITNVGEVRGKEAAQVYIRELKPSVIRPLKELKAFSKVDLTPGEEAKVVLNLDKDAFKFWDDRGSGVWTASSGEFEVSVGTSSVDLPLKGIARLTQTLTWLGL